MASPDTFTESLRPHFAHASHWRTLGFRRRVVPQVQPIESQPRFVTVAEVARLLRVSNMTVYRLIQSGQLPAVRVGRSYRIREADVDRYLADQYTQAG
jgi:excisionase family DNA binding protein